MRASLISLVDGSGGRHDNYGSALAAQPGESQRRPATNTSSQLIVRIGMPAPSCSRCLCPGWSHQTPRSENRSRTSAPTSSYRLLKCQNIESVLEFSPPPKNVDAFGQL